MSDFNKESLELHKKYKGKISISNKIEVNDKDDLSRVYSSGVAAPCLEIYKKCNFCREKSQDKMQRNPMCGHLICTECVRIVQGTETRSCFTCNVIVVNDGSTDFTYQILDKYPHIEIIHISKNKGKGNALNIGFKQAFNKGFKYAITIDSDGQHFPKDIPVFIDALENEENKNVLFIGNRNMEQDGIPKKSSFGHKFSNFWFWVETGTWSKDTQSGYRLYPLKEIEKLKLYTKKFEFEIEVIVKLAWSGTLVKNVPIDIVYEETDRVSHFRPFHDFTRISI